ncbi:MAG: hypothetical protein Athens041674_699 [Parcubacteria group bacterium Athens0416_74]|nr:MAG: hypothetical protein Athens041674_699 [Parcubacteria group bacterium Athens0416_74]
MRSKPNDEGSAEPGTPIDKEFIRQLYISVSEIRSSNDPLKNMQALMRDVELINGQDLPQDIKLLHGLMSTLAKANRDIGWRERGYKVGGEKGPQVQLLSEAESESFKLLTLKIRNAGWEEYERQSGGSDSERKMPKEFSPQFLRYAMVLHEFQVDDPADFAQRLEELARYILDHDLPKDRDFVYDLVHHVKNAAGWLPYDTEEARKVNDEMSKLVGEVVYKCNNQDFT